MKFSLKKYLQLNTGFTLKETLVTLGVLAAGLLLTMVLVIFNRQNVKEAAYNDFQYSCNQVRINIETRLWNHAQLLRAGKGLFAVSDTVTHDEWHQFYLTTKIAEYLPGIQGFGYSLLIPKDKLKEHEEFFRKVYSNYKPDYRVYPTGDREIYSSIIMLEPHNERNRVALGYDMFSDPVRRKAMEISRDSNFAMLSGMVKLVQEIDTDVQPGVLMYAPDYRRDMPVNTVRERRAALRGWVYSPYRMRDLMKGIRSTMSDYQQQSIHFRIYDDTVISRENLLFDSYELDSIKIRNPNLNLTLKTLFNGKVWTIVYEGRKEELSMLHREQLFIIIPGLIITLLMFTLSLMQIRANIRRGETEALYKQLEILNNDKDKFISILSHDLKSPFTSILGFLELLKNGVRKFSPEQIENYINTIYDASKNTYRLLEDILMWTRAHTGRIPFNPQVHQLRDIYDSVIKVLLPVAESKNIKVIYSAGDNLTIYADKDMIKAILRNLVSNAIKFTTDGSVTISAWEENDGLLVSISDTGIGIKTEQQPSLFDISKIFPSAGTNGEKGTGLGLIICKEFIDLHGGRIWYSSEWGKGSDFRFFLPRKK
ncbi:MAG TPA: CHASE domain-containing protein [Bacteroidales bacterium]|nr:CHASE domain-containing protein [Bacteroidales bacterium]